MSLDRCQTGDLTFRNEREREELTESGVATAFLLSEANGGSVKLS